VFDTNLVIVGNVLNAPEWRRITTTGTLVANFRMASTSRRYDRDSGRWVDGNSLRVRVTAWRRLAEGVASSVTTGDPIVVFGKLYCRDWKDENDNHRVSYEMEAISIGHDLARGRAKFFRTKLVQGTSEIDGAGAEAYVGGQYSTPLIGVEEPVVYGEGLPDRLPGEDEPTFLDVIAGAEGVPVTEGAPATDPVEPADPDAPEPPAPDGTGEGETAGEDLVMEVEQFVAAQPGTTRRTRRSSKREPVPA
jgi:single-strand DNA-binding protein